MQSIRSLRSLPINAVVRRASFEKLGYCRLNSCCVIQKVTGASSLQQSVPLLAAFRVSSRHFSLTSDESSSELPFFDICSKLVLMNGQPFTGCGQVNYSVEHNYTGDFVDGKRHGQGVIKNIKGDIYEGEFKNNLKDGHGVITDTDGTILSQGLFKKGKLFTGTGHIVTRGDIIYEGELLEGQRHGQGKLTNKSGLVWEGEFRHNEPFNCKGWYRRKQGVWKEGVFTADYKKQTGNTGITNVSRYSNSNVVGSVKKERKRAVKLEEEESEWDLP